jgi:hypothetical protein
MSMLRYLSGAKPPPPNPPKSESDKNKKKNEYEQKRVRKFLDSWKVGREWLVNDGGDGGKGMKCTYCSDHFEKIKHLVRSRQFIDGTKAYKADTLAYHEKSEAHKLASTIEQNSKGSAAASAPAVKAVQQLNKSHFDRLTQGCHYLSE